MNIALNGANGTAEEDEGEDGAANDAEDVAGWEGHGWFFRYVEAVIDVGCCRYVYLVIRKGNSVYRSLRSE